MKRSMQVIIMLLALVGVSIEVYASLFADDAFIIGFHIFKYFTIQSNILVFLYFLLLLIPDINNKEWFQTLLPGVVIYITITFVVFATMLQGQFPITGIRILGNYLVHYIVPILSILYLVLYGRRQYTTNDMFKWLVYPILYLLFLFIFGAITNDYIYPFFNLNELRLFQVIVTVVIMVVFFTGLSFIVVKILSKKDLTI